jgi:hypothetical protein
MDSWRAVKTGLTVVCLMGLAGASSGASAPVKVQSPRLTVEVDPNGKLVSLSGASWRRAATGGFDCPNGKVTQCAVEATRDGGTEVKRTWEAGGQTFSTTERIMPTPTSVRWQMEVAQWTDDKGAKPVPDAVFALRWPAVDGVKFWAPWAKHPDGGLDVLKPAAFANYSFPYGTGIGSTSGVVMPLASVLEDDGAVGLSVAMSPEDRICGVQIGCTDKGELRLSRTGNTAAGQVPYRITVDLVPQGGDWREGLGWMRQRYAKFFEPAVPATAAQIGCGTYARHAGEIDANAFRRMNFTFNWSARFEWPYQAMNLPPVKDGEAWTGWYKDEYTYQDLRDYAGRMRKMGFRVLQYWSLTETGNYVKWPAPPRQAADDADLWKNANDFVHYCIPDAVVRDAAGKPAYSNWNGCIVTDPGEAKWLGIVLDQARRLVAKVPETGGICIDRMDHLPRFQRQGRLILMGWREAMAKLGPILHDANKIILANPINCRRLDAMENLDGLYDEYYHDTNIAASAMLCVSRPVVIWNSPRDDAGFQRLLYYGVFPSVPYPGADHNLGGSADGKGTPLHHDYGPLFKLIQGKRWVLEAGAVSVREGGVLANLFAVPGGWALPVIGGKEGKQATVFVRYTGGLKAGVSVEAHHPGADKPVAVEAQGETEGVQLTVPLVRGCAVVMLRGK